MRKPPEKVRGIILRRTKYAESDLIVHVLTSQGAKLTCLARGALKSKKRFAGGVLEPTHFVEMLLQHGAQADSWPVLQEARILEDFAGLRSTYEKIELALEFVEIASKIAQLGDLESKALFDMLGNALRALQGECSIETLRVHFGLKILMHQGVLEPDAWMAAFLKTAISNQNLTQLPAVNLAQQHWVHEQINIYLKTAERNH